MAFLIGPKVARYNTCKEFAQGETLGANDLIVTNAFIDRLFLAELQLPCQVLYQERYGNGEPTDVMIDAMCEDAKGLRFDRVIAIGGGSVMDMAKFVALKQGFSVLELVDGKIIPERSKGLLCVPTTCGTGSEVTCLSAIDQTTRGTKVGFGTPAMYADTAVLIPELLSSLPLHFFATSSIDAFIHAIESYLSPGASRESKLFSMEAMQLILKGYLCMEREGADARFAESENFLTASMYAGIAFGNAGTGAVHAMSYPLGSNYHVPHGEANYAMFRGVFGKYMEKDPNGRIAELNEKLAVTLDCARDEVYEVIVRLFDNVLPAKPLHEYGMTEADCRRFADIVDTKQGRLTKNNYVKLSCDDYAAIYRSLY